MQSEKKSAVALLPVSDRAIAAMRKAQKNKWMKASGYNHSNGVYTYSTSNSQEVINEMINFYEFTFSYIEKDSNGKTKVYKYFDKKVNNEH
jgi:hypothetical protein